jgi:uncharacterized membrane protein
MKKLILLLTLTIFLANSVTAFTFLNIYLDDKGQATFIGETSDSPILPEGIQIQNNNIFGKTSTLTNKQADLWSFSYTLEGADIILILPEGSVIKDISNGDISISDNQISISSTDEINITYEIDESLIDTKSSGFILLGLILTAALIILIVFLINYSKREKHGRAKVPAKTDKLKLLTSILTDREKTIIKQLKSSGKIKQSYLRKLTKIPKASFSRHIQQLEKKKLIKRSGEGKNKFVELIN